MLLYYILLHNLLQIWHNSCVFVATTVNRRVILRPSTTPGTNALHPWDIKSFVIMCGTVVHHVSFRVALDCGCYNITVRIVDIAQCTQNDTAREHDNEILTVKSNKSKSSRGHDDWYCLFHLCICVCTLRLWNFNANRINDEREFWVPKMSG